MELNDRTRSKCKKVRFDELFVGDVFSMGGNGLYMKVEDCKVEDCDNTCNAVSLLNGEYTPWKGKDVVYQINARVEFEFIMENEKAGEEE